MESQHTIYSTKFEDKEIVGNCYELCSLYNCDKYAKYISSCEFRINLDGKILNPIRFYYKVCSKKHGRARYELSRLHFFLHNGHEVIFFGQDN